MVNNPIIIIRKNTIYSDDRLLEKFEKHIMHLYQYELFKPILDLVATKMIQGVFKFKVQDQKVFDLDAGNCKTIQSNMLDSILNKFRTQKSYLITIKQISYDVILHEIGHMLEHELDLDLTQFAHVILSEITKKSRLITVDETIHDIMIKQINSYPANQRNSELLARYFQLFALSRDIAGYESNLGYRLQDIQNHFSMTGNWIMQNIFSKLVPKTNADIALYSNSFLKPISEVKHKWSEQKVKALHNHQRTKWSKTVKSIKSSDFF